MGVAEDLPPERSTVPVVLFLARRQTIGKAKKVQQITIFPLLRWTVLWQCLRRNF